MPSFEQECYFDIITMRTCQAVIQTIISWTYSRNIRLKGKRENLQLNVLEPHGKSKKTGRENFHLHYSFNPSHGIKPTLLCISRWKLGQPSTSLIFKQVNIERKIWVEYENMSQHPKKTQCVTEFTWRAVASDTIFDFFFEENTEQSKSFMAAMKSKTMTPSHSHFWKLW